MCLSPLVEEPNSEFNKRFVPEQRSCLYFVFPCICICICTVIDIILFVNIQHRDKKKVKRNKERRLVQLYSSTDTPTTWNVRHFIKSQVFPFLIKIFFYRFQMPIYIFIFDLFFFFAEGVEVFKKYLKSQFCDENIDFWLAVEKYRCLDEDELDRQGNIILKTFVIKKAARAVSIIFHLIVRLSFCHKDMISNKNDIVTRYHTITDVCTTALLLTKPSSDDDWIQAWFRDRSIITTSPKHPSSSSRHH